MSDIINPSLKTAVKGTAQVFLGMVISILLWFLTKILIIRNTTKEEFGIYSLVIAIAGIFSLLATLGLQEGVPRYISIFLSQGKRKDANAVSIDALFIGLLSGLFLFSLLYYFSGILSRQIFYKIQLEVPLKIISFFIPFSVSASIMNGILRGHSIVKPKVFTDMGQPFFFLLFLGIFFLLKLPFISIIYAYTISMGVILLVIVYYLLHATDLDVRSLSWGNTVELLRFSFPLLIVSVLIIVLGWTDTLMLGRYTKAESVGIYNVSSSLARLLAFPLNAIAFVFLPIAAEMYAKRQNAELQRTYQVLTKWTFIVTFPFFFILFFFPEMTITYLFGERFIDASLSLRILSLCFLFNTFLGTNGILLIAMGMSRVIMNVSFLGVVMNIGLNYVLIKQLGYGVVGASVSTLTSYMALNIINSLFLYRQSKIHPLTLKYIRPVIGAGIIGLIIYALAKNLPLYPWMLPVYLILFISGYFLSLLFTKSIENEDIQLLVGICRKLGFESNSLVNYLKKFG